jgi:MinD-like ATPase involved in chromosome partitioning or flagellar assembly
VITALYIVGPHGALVAARLREQYNIPEPIVLPSPVMAMHLLGNQEPDHVGVIALQLPEEEGRQFYAFLRERFPVNHVALVGDVLNGGVRLPTFTAGDDVGLASHLGITRRLRTRVVVPINIKGGAGKSTVTINLAAALAQQGRRVLLVDGDLTDGDIATLTGLEEQAAEHSLLRVAQDHPMGGLSYAGIQRHLLHWHDVDVLCSSTLLDMDLPRINNMTFAPELFAAVAGYYDVVCLDLPADKRFSAFGGWAIQSAPPEQLLYLLVLPPQMAEEAGALRGWKLLHQVGRGERTALVLNRWDEEAVIPRELAAARLPEACRIPPGLDVIQRAARLHRPVIALETVATKGGIRFGAAAASPTEPIQTAFHSLATYVIRYFGDEGVQK